MVYMDTATFANHNSQKAVLEEMEINLRGMNEVMIRGIE